MKKIQHISITTLFLITLFSGCSSSHLSSTTNNEFISLDKKANVELGYVQIDGTKIEFSYSGALLMTDGREYTGYIGLFSDKQKEQIVAMTSDDAMMPNLKRIIVNIPSIADGYDCKNIDTDEKDSSVIKDTEVYYIEAKGCKGKGQNKGKLKDITLKITESVISAGTSQLSIKDKKAYLKTDYQVNAKLSVSGGLGTRTYNQIFNLIKKHPEVDTIVEGYVSGSVHDDINMQTGKLIRKAGLATHLTKDSNIASGGVDLFCSGKKRTMETGAKIGVHSWSGDGEEASKLPQNDPLHQNQINYFTQMLGDPDGKVFYFYTIHAALATGMHYMTAPEIQKYKLLTERKY